MTEFPQLEREIAGSLEKLEKRGGRSLASASDEAERERWLDWAEVQLKRTQRLLDAAEEDPNLAEPRARLGEAANEFVAFHGYAQAGQNDRMLEVLKRGLEHGRFAKQMVCR